MPETPKEIVGDEDDGDQVNEKIEIANSNRRKSFRIQRKLSITEEKSEEETKIDEEAEKNHKMSEPDNLVRSSKKRSISVHGNGSVIEAVLADTPVSNVIKSLVSATIDSSKIGEVAFKTPKRARGGKPNAMTMESPLSLVSAERGSSKRKRNISIGKENSIANIFEDLEGSPLLAKLDAKVQSNELITEHDLDGTDEPAAKQIKLNDQFEILASNDESLASKEEVSEEKDVNYFRNLVSSETTRLETKCKVWDDKIETEKDKLNEDMNGEIR